MFVLHVNVKLLKMYVYITSYIHLPKLTKVIETEAICILQIHEIPWLKTFFRFVCYNGKRQKNLCLNNT